MAALLLVVADLVVLDRAASGHCRGSRPGTAASWSGRRVDAGPPTQWRAELVRAPPAASCCARQGWWSPSGVSVLGVAGAYVVAGRALRPLQPGHHDRPARSPGDARPADPLRRRRRRGGRAGRHVRRDAGPDQHRVRDPETVRGQRLARAADPAGGDADRGRRDPGRPGRRRRRVPADGQGGPGRLATRANGLVDALLVLARSEAQARQGLARASRPTSPRWSRRRCPRCAKESDRDLAVSTETRPARGRRPALLDRLAGNLIENAVRYNTARADRVTTPTGPSARTCRAQHRLRGAGRGRRRAVRAVPPGGTERTGGPRAGLGLSIVRAVAEAHGGAGCPAVASSRGRGLELTVTPPAATTRPGPGLARPTPPGRPPRQSEGRVAAGGWVNSEEWRACRDCRGRPGRPSARTGPGSRPGGRRRGRDPAAATTLPAGAWARAPSAAIACSPWRSWSAWSRVSRRRRSGTAAARSRRGS